MTEQTSMSSRALVLGGGGVTGIAWEVGVLAGLLGAGVDLRDADLVVGTSAGSFVGVAYASGHDVEALYAEQLEPPGGELATSASEATVQAWLRAFETGGADPRKVGVAYGAISLADPEPVSHERRRAVVASRLVARDWPANLSVTAIEAETGELHVFDASSGVALIDAVSASGAVPGVWPLERFGGHPWIDGGMVSSANARLAEGYERVVVIAPMPWGFGEIPGAMDDLAALQVRSRAELIAPDQAAIDEIGPNVYDPARRPPAAIAGRRQGAEAAASIAATWAR